MRFDAPTSALLACICVTASAGDLAVSAQSAPQFEAATVKRNTSGTNFVELETLPGGRFTTTNATLLMLIASAWQLRSFQIVGAPSWADTDGYDIVATPGAGSAPDAAATRTMVQALLEERFKLRVRKDRRVLPTYNLVLGRRDGQLGPTLTRGTIDCDAERARQRSGAAPPAPIEGCRVRLGVGNITADGVTMPRFAELLISYAERMVSDRTGLTGAFNIKLVWAPERQVSGVTDPDAPSLFTAFQEQLGLRLEPSRGPVDVLVVDSAERPSTN